MAFTQQEPLKFTHEKGRKERKTHYIYKSAITGKFVPRIYAESHPDTTFKVKVITENGKTVITSTEKGH